MYKFISIWGDYFGIWKVERVDVRELWKHEQYNFSEWLAKEEKHRNVGMRLE